MTDCTKHGPDCIAGEGQTHWYACEERIKELESERDKAMAALRSLTPQGSEYQTIEECVAGARGIRDMQKESIKRFKSERDEAQQMSQQRLEIITGLLERIAVLERDEALDHRAMLNLPHDLEEALVAFSAAAHRLSFVWEKASIPQDRRIIEGIMSKEYPFADSFDETVGRIMLWKADVLEALNGERSDG